MRNSQKRLIGFSLLCLVFAALLSYGVFQQNQFKARMPKRALVQSVADLYLRGGTLVSMVPGTGPQQATIRIKNGRIAEIGKALDIPADARIIDVSGQYIFPGLTDMHAHVTFLRDTSKAPEQSFDRQTSEKVLKALLAYGITTVRNPAAPAAEGVKLREDVNRGLIAGPRIFTAGWPLNDRRASAETIRQEVDAQCAKKVDYLKVYANLSSEQTAIAIDQAHRCGLKVLGHLQNTDWPTAARLGIDFLTHGVSWSASALPAAKRDEYLAQIKTQGAMKARIFWLESVNPEGPETGAVIAALKQHAVSVDPTLVAYETKFIPLDHYRSESNLKLAPQALRASWLDDDLTNDWSPQDYARMKKAWPKMLAIIQRYYRSGVLLTAGSDLPNRFVVPGVSLHQELALLHQAGLPNEAVLASATRNAALALGQSHETGTLETGKRADLVVIDKNPLDDLRHLRSIRLVVANGKLFHPKDLLAQAIP